MFYGTAIDRLCMNIMLVDIKGMIYIVFDPTDGNVAKSVAKLCSHSSLSRLIMDDEKK
jgi:hypothetical protein